MIINTYGIKPVLVNPAFVKIAKSFVAGAFLSHIMYWHNKGRIKGWIYKTVEEIYEETGITKSQQSTSIKIWTSKKVLEVKLKGIPRRRFFRADEEKIHELINAHKEELGLQDIGNQSSGFEPTAGYILTPITESTQENTQKNTSEISIYNRGENKFSPDSSFNTSKEKQLRERIRSWSEKTRFPY